MIWIAVFVTAASLGFLVWQLAAGPDAARVRASANLRRGMPAARAASAPKAGAPAGLISNQYLSSATQVIITKGTRSRLERMLAQAGRPQAWPLERVVQAKVLLTLAGVVVGAYALLAAPSSTMRLVGVAAAVIMHFLPELRLYSLGIERREKITLELADTLDQMSIAVEAGLGFDAAMIRVAKNGTGFLAQELVRTLQDIQVGQTRRAAYEDLVERTQVPDLKQFVRSIIQAEAYGLALSTVLNTQAAEMRMKRRQRAEAKAMQIPVKVIFPLMLCILPVLFMVVMGPGVINIMASFGK
ncbi:MAG: type II secretion system F family protein [Actinomycetia bacterium]|nr:type II secretion system F family protein [Actinomycetes bacterium]